MQRKINIDVSNSEICEVVEYYNKLISEIIEIYEEGSESNSNNRFTRNIPNVFKKTILYRTLRHIKYKGMSNTINKIKSNLAGGKNENNRS